MASAGDSSPKPRRRDRDAPMNTNEIVLPIFGLLLMAALVGLGLSRTGLKPWWCIVASEIILLSIYAATFDLNVWRWHPSIIAPHLLGLPLLLAAMFAGYYVHRFPRTD